MKAKIGSNYLETKTGEILCICGYLSSSPTNEISPDGMMEVMVYRGLRGNDGLYVDSIKVPLSAEEYPVIAYQMAGCWSEIGSFDEAIKLASGVVL